LRWTEKLFRHREEVEMSVLEIMMTGDRERFRKAFV